MKSDIDDLMQSHNLDALLVLGDAEHNPSMYYLTGGGHISGAVLLKKRGEPPVLFYNDMERGEAARTGLALRSLSELPLDPELQTAGDYSSALALRMKAILTEMGLTGGRIGVYGHVELGQAMGMLMKLQELLPGLEIIGEDGMGSVFVRARETKEQAEIERIRKVGRVTVEVVGLTAEYLTSREVREDEVLLDENGKPLKLGRVKDKIRLWIVERGLGLPEGCIFSIGHDAGVPHSMGEPEDLMRLGKTIIFDIFPAEPGGGYFYDFTRTWSLGYATPEAEQLYGQVYEIFQRLRDQFKLNVPFKEYQRMTCEYFESKGHQSQLSTAAPLEGYVHSLGHGVGLDVHERPGAHLRAGDDHRLIAGVVFACEPGLYYPDQGMGFRIEDTLWMRPDGQTETLAEYPYDFVLPMKKWKKQ